MRIEVYSDMTALSAIRLVHTEAPAGKPFALYDHDSGRILAWSSSERAAYKHRRNMHRIAAIETVAQ